MGVIHTRTYWMSKSIAGDCNKDKHRSVNFPDVRDAIARISRGERATTSFLNVPSLLQFWLWGSDANEVCDRGKCDFHLMHLTGMVCTRVFSEAYHDAGDPVDFTPGIIDDEDVRILTDGCGIFLPHFYEVTSTETVTVKEVQIKQNAFSTPEKSKDTHPHTESHKNNVVVSVPDTVSLQQLRDLVHAVQTQWPLMQKMVEDSGNRERQLEMLQVVDRLVTQLFVWFGYYLFESNIKKWQADDTEFVDGIPPTHALALTQMGIKFYLNIFFVLFRLLFLQRHSIAVPTGRNSVSGCYPFAIETFHVEAGVDDFHLLGMYSDIPAGCLLEYKHSYSGFYNNVSQVVYRHFPSYKRRTPRSLADVMLEDASNISVLPAIKQIYPEIEFAFEDHHFYREVAGVRMAVLLAPVPPPSTDIVNTTTMSTGKNTSTDTRNYRVSEKLQARLNVCKDGAGQSGDSSGGGTEGMSSVRTIDWLWFSIGGNVYLVCTTQGVVYSGPCRDLLAFYLSVTNKE
jgi:hypothetical protein